MTLHAIGLHEPVTLRGLALVLGQARNQVAEAVEQLVAEGWVRRQRVAAAYAVTLHLTAAGRQVFDDFA